MMKWIYDVSFISVVNFILVWWTELYLEDNLEDLFGENYFDLKMYLKDITL